jgi:hypothetical protein
MVGGRGGSAAHDLGAVAVVRGLSQIVGGGAALDRQGYGSLSEDNVRREGGEAAAVLTERHAAIRAGRPLDLVYRNLPAPGPDSYILTAAGWGPQRGQVGQVLPQACLELVLGGQQPQAVWQQAWPLQ